MSTDDATNDGSWYSSLNEDERTDLVTRVAAQLEDQDGSKVPRRDLLKAAGVGMAGLSLGAGAVASDKINADDIMHRASAQSAAAGQVGTATEPVDVFASAVDTDELSLANQNFYVYAASGDYLTSIAPSSSSSPAQDSLDYAGNNGGGTVVFPHNTKFSETGNVLLHDGVDIVGNGAEMEIQGDGNDGLVVDNSEALTTNYLQCNIYGELTVSHVNGDNGNTGIGCHLVSGVSNSHWGKINFDGWNGRALYEELNAASYQWLIDHLHFTNVDAGDANGVMDWQGGGAPIDIRYISAYPTDTGSLSDSHIFRCDSKSARIGVMNIGGSPDQAVRANTTGIDGIHVGHINYEPGSQNGTPNAIVFANGINPTKIHSTHVNGATVDYVFGQFAAGNNYWGTVRDGGTINLGHLDNRNDTNRTVIFEGQSTDVVDNSGVTLTVPIACLGDLTTVP